MTKDTVLRVRVDRQTLVALLKMARDQECTQSEVIRSALDTYLFRGDQ